MACSVEKVTYLQWVWGGLKRAKEIMVNDWYKTKEETDQVKKFIVTFEAVYRDTLHAAEILARQPRQGWFSHTKEIYDELLSCYDGSPTNVASRKSMLSQAAEFYEQSGDFLMAQKSQELLLELLTEGDESSVDITVLSTIRKLVDLYEKVSARLDTMAEELGLNITMTLAVSPVLHRAIRQNNVLLVSEALRRLERSNDIDILERNALHCAIECRSLPMLEFLIQRGYPLYRSDFAGAIPLYLAAENGFTDGVRKLIEAEGRNQNDLNHPRWRVLRTAVERGYLTHADLRIDAAILVTSEGAKVRYEHAFVAAAKGGALGIVELLLEKGVDVNAIANKPCKQTAVSAAAEYGHLQIVEYLLASGANINAIPGKFQCKTPLQAAASSGYLNIVRSLITSGANVNAAATMNQRTALHGAAAHGHGLILELLIQSGATIDDDPEYPDEDPELSDEDRAFPGEENQTNIIDDARKGQHWEVVQRLIAFGAVDYGKLEAAVKQGNLELVKELVKNQGSLEDEATISYSRSISAAVRGRSLRILQFLIDYGADLNIDKKVRIQAAFNEAARDGHLWAVKYFIARGADVNHDNWGKRPALHAAARNGHLSIVELLIMMGVNTGPQKYRGGSALHAAAEGGHIEVVKRLIQSGVGLDDTSGYYGTALHVAAGGGHLEVIRLLVESGANVNTAVDGDWRETALQAAAYRHIDICKFLIQSGADLHADPAPRDGRTALQRAAAGGDIAIMKLLIGMGANVNDKPAPFGGRTALQAAAECHHLRAVRLLIQSGAHVNANPAFKNGLTALQAATDLDIAMLLIGVGANTNADESKCYGERSLPKAVADNNLKMLEILIEHGAHISSGEWTLLDQAKRHRNIAMIELLIAAGVVC